MFATDYCTADFELRGRTHYLANMIATADRRDALLAALYFLASTLITYCFIIAGGALYADEDKMLLSCSIAGAKWTIQIIAALLLLHGKRWLFVRRIGFTCLIGSLILLPFCFEPVRRLAGHQGFLASLEICVATMIGLYYRSVRQTGLSMHWFWGWMVCLGIAIALQLTVVFQVL